MVAFKSRDDIIALKWKHNEIVKATHSAKQRRVPSSHESAVDESRDGVSVMTGFTLTPDWITPVEEAQLVEQLRPLLSDTAEKDGGNGRSAIVRFGWDYNIEDRWTQDIPEWLTELNVLKAHFGVVLNSVTVNRYQKGDTIAPHIDSLKFGELVLILSLLECAQLTFRMPHPKIHTPSFTYDIPARSLVGLGGDARYKYQHSIAPVKAERISVVFRKRLL